MGFGVIDVSICVEHVFFVDIIFKNPVFRQNTETTMTKARLLFFAQFLETSSFLLGSMGALISQLPDSKLSRSYHEALMSLIPKGSKSTPYKTLGSVLRTTLRPLSLAVTIAM